MCQSLETLSQLNVCFLGDGRAWTCSTDGGNVSVQRQALACSWSWKAEAEGKGEGLAVESY